MEVERKERLQTTPALEAAEEDPKARKHRALEAVTVGPQVRMHQALVVAEAAVRAVQLHSASTT